MKKFRQGWMLLALTAVLVLGGSGCMGLFQQTNENVTEAALAYMAQRYGQEFVYAGPWGGGYDSTASKTFLVRPAGRETGQQILVEVQKNGEQYLIRDNYLALKYEQAVRDQLQQTAESVFGAAKTYYTASAAAVLSPQLSADATFEEYLWAEGSDIIATIAIPEAQYRPDLSGALEDALRIAGFQGLFRLAVLSQAQYDSVTEEQLRVVIGTKAYVSYEVLTVTHSGTQPQTEEGINHGNL